MHEVADVEHFNKAVARMKVPVEAVHNEMDPSPAKIGGKDINKLL